MEDGVRWEYKAVHSFDGKVDFREDEQHYLDRMGNEGWELIAVAAHGAPLRVLYFKRPKP